MADRREIVGNQRHTEKRQSAGKGRAEIRQRNMQRSRQRRTAEGRHKRRPRTLSGRRQASRNERKEVRCEGT